MSKIETVFSSTSRTHKSLSQNNLPGWWCESLVLLVTVSASHTLQSMSIVTKIILKWIWLTNRRSSLTFTALEKEEVETWSQCPGNGWCGWVMGRPSGEPHTQEHWRMRRTSGIPHIELYTPMIVNTVYYRPEKCCRERSFSCLLDN